MTTEEHFDELQAGDFKTLDSRWSWQVVKGRCLIDDQHAKTGRQCLQLSGGESTVVELGLSEAVDTSGKLSFWAERWTARQPFSCRIEKYSQGKWTEIYNGDREVIVGRAFKAFVTFPRDAEIEKLSFGDQPSDTGVTGPPPLCSISPPACVDRRASMTLPALVGRSPVRF